MKQKQAEQAENSASGSQEIRALAGARAFPPLLLVMFHFSEGHGYRGWWPIDLVVARGYLWVEFFFALSGFVLTYAYGARLAALWTGRGYRRFLQSRLIRLYPLHLFLLLTLAAMVLGLRLLAHAGGYHSIFDVKYHQDISAKGFVLSMFLMQAWNTMDRLTWNGVSWFVSVEWALCLLFPLLLWLASNRPWRGALLILAGLAGLTALDLASPHGLDITYHNGVLRGLSDFSCGVGMAILFRVLKPRDRLGEAGHSILQLALVTALFYAAYHTGWSHTHADIWMVLPMMALVLALAFDRGLVARALHARLFQKVGAWSYAIYLGQTVWLLGIRFFEQRLYPDPDTMVLGMRFSTLIWGLEPVGLLLLCLIWGALLAIFVEHPAAKALRPLLDRRSPATPP